MEKGTAIAPASPGRGFKDVQREAYRAFHHFCLYQSRPFDWLIITNRSSDMKARIFLFFYVVTILSAIVLATATAQEQQPVTKQPSAEPLKDIIESASAAGNFNIFLKAVEVAGLKDTLKGAGPYTVFAPTDEAFAKLPAGELDAL